MNCECYLCIFYSEKNYLIYVQLTNVFIDCKPYYRGTFPLDRLFIIINYRILNFTISFAIFTNKLSI